MTEQEDPELTFSHMHPQITTIYRATIEEKDQKRFSTTKDIEKQSQQEGQEGQSCNIVRIHTPGWMTHKQEDNYYCKGSPQGVRERSKPHTGLLYPEVLH